MAGIVYSLCALTSLVCTLLLLRSYKQTRYRLLLWAGICFCGITLNNVLLVADKLIFPDLDFVVWRHMISLVALLFLIYGLIFDE
ncbi:MAG: hypothetical protein EOO68_01240 [Moraxellaceae bacterium]|jgi:hypothetical protein|nr:MAG: hypothetical protein EOO68_01240 [Moraxellaceae bacterium]